MLTLIDEDEMEGVKLTAPSFPNLNTSLLNMPQKTHENNPEMNLNFLGKSVQINGG